MLNIAICDDNFSQLELIEKEIVKTLFNENEINIDLYEKYEELDDVTKEKLKIYDLMFLFIDKNN